MDGCELCVSLPSAVLVLLALKPSLTQRKAFNPKNNMPDDVNFLRLILQMFGGLTKRSVGWFCQQRRLTCYSIRHGESEYNSHLIEFAKRLGIKYVHGKEAQQEFQFKLELVDAGLTELGRKQAEETSDELRDVNDIQIVFVSPLERALQTAKIIFHNHKGIRFIVMPEITEIFSKICDISVDVPDKMGRFAEMDFRLLRGRERTWQAQLLDWQHQRQVQMLMRQGQRAPNEILKYYIKLLKKDFPDPMETAEHCTKRVLKAAQTIRRICNSQGVSTIGLVSHRRILRQLTKTKQLERGLGYQNCQVVKIAI